MTDKTVAGAPASPLSPDEIYRLAGERMVELIVEGDELRAELETALAGQGDRDITEIRRLLDEAERGIRKCRRAMEVAQERMEERPDETDTSTMDAAWTAAAQQLETASREIRYLTRRRAEFALELYAQERMTAEEAETRLRQIEARLALLGTIAERARLAITVIEAREDRQLAEIGRRAGSSDRRLRPRL